MKVKVTTHWMAASVRELDRCIHFPSGGNWCYARQRPLVSLTNETTTTRRSAPRSDAWHGSNARLVCPTILPDRSLASSQGSEGVSCWRVRGGRGKYKIYGWFGAAAAGREESRTITAFAHRSAHVFVYRSGIHFCSVDEISSCVPLGEPFSSPVVMRVSYYCGVSLALRKWQRLSNLAHMLMYVSARLSSRSAARQLGDSRREIFHRRRGSGGEARLARSEQETGHGGMPSY